MNPTHRFSTCLALTALLAAGCAQEPTPPPARAATPVTHVSSGKAADPIVAHVKPGEATNVERVPLPQAPPTREESAAAWREGPALFAAGDFAHASSKLEIALSGRPDDAYAHYLLGLSRWKEGRPKEAEPSLERAASLGAGSLKTWINLARVRLDLEKAAPALEAAERALAIDPKSSDALHQKGRALAQLGRTPAALEALQQAHEAAPENGYIANTLGYWLIQNGSESQAVALLEDARDRLPGVAYVRNNLGVAYERTGRSSEAIAEFQAAVEAGDTGGKAAMSLARLGRPVEPTEVPGPNVASVQGTSVANRTTDQP